MTGNTLLKSSKYTVILVYKYHCECMTLTCNSVHLPSIPQCIYSVWTLQRFRVCLAETHELQTLTFNRTYYVFNENMTDICSLPATCSWSGCVSCAAEFRKTRNCSCCGRNQVEVVRVCLVSLAAPVWLQFVHPTVSSYWEWTTPTGREHAIP